MREYNITLDIHKEDNNVNDVWFMQNDIGGKLYFSLLDNEIPINLTDCKVISIFENSDKEIFEKDMEITDIENGRGTINVSSSILAKSGKSKVSIKLYRGEELRVTFTAFSMTCKKTPDIDEAVYGSDEIDVVQTIADTNAKITKLNNTLDTTLIEVDNMIVDLGDNVEANINTLNTEVREDINELDTNVTNDITTLKTEVLESITGLEENVTETIESINTLVDTTVLEVNTKVEETVETINNALEDVTEQVNENLEALDNAKIDVIVSNTKPDIVGLRIGTIWIRPVIEEE